MTSTDWNFDCDVLLVGSGGGALTGAFVAASEGLDVMVIESTNRFGGTTCYSGGAVWLPGNRASARAGLDDTNDIALEYFQRIVGDRTPADLQRAFVRNGPPVVEYLERSPRIDFEWMAFPDYYGDIGCPPAHARGRDVLTQVLPIAELGQFAGKLRLSMANDIAGVPEPDPLMGGRALVGRLLLACHDAGVRFLLNCEMHGLIVEDGKVIGAEAVYGGRPTRFRARRGVILAAGGFERNQQMRDEFGVAGDANWSCGAPGGTGKAIRAGMEIGAATDLMTECWFMPGLIQPNGRTGFIASVNGGIIVNGAGERFGNETGPYDRFGRKMREGDTTGVPHVPAWWVWDASFGPSIPSVYNSMPILDRETYTRAGLWKQGATLAELAAEIGVPAEGLTLTVERFNRFAATGVDEDFHRGETPYDLYIASELPALFGLGETTKVGSPNACLIPLTTGPYYAAKVGLGDLGSKGGLKTDATARVLRPDGSVIPGLYAAGDTMAAASGEAYPAPGTPIGSCMVFSYLAAMDMARTPNP
ncbi:MAG: 3-ketosteroid-delta-dehydrogenase [Rhodospirillales bacterium]|nr:3-ketosteroid-delta-dehydrogenase [Rhodospirillales bacterium]